MKSIFPTSLLGAKYCVAHRLTHPLLSVLPSKSKRLTYGSSKMKYPPEHFNSLTQFDPRGLMGQYKIYLDHQHLHCFTQDLTFRVSKLGDEIKLLFLLGSICFALKGTLIGGERDEIICWVKGRDFFDFLGGCTHVVIGIRWTGFNICTSIYLYIYISGFYCIETNETMEIGRAGIHFWDSN